MSWAHPLYMLPAPQSREISHVFHTSTGTATRVQMATNAPEERPTCAGQARCGPGPPPGRDRTARSRLGAARGSPRHPRRPHCPDGPRSHPARPCEAAQKPPRAPPVVPNAAGARHWHRCVRRRPRRRPAHARGAPQRPLEASGGGPPAARGRAVDSRWQRRDGTDTYGSESSRAGCAEGEAGACRAWRGGSSSAARRRLGPLTRA